MTTLLENISQDRLTARKNKDEVKSSLLTILLSDAVNIGKNDGNRETTEDEAIKLIRKYVSTAQENAKIYTDSGNVTALDKTNQELSILKEYLPQAPSDEAVKAFIAEKIASNNWPKENATMGKVMKELKSKYGTTLDGALASKLIKEQLQ